MFIGDVFRSGSPAIGTGLKAVASAGTRVKLHAGLPVNGRVIVQAHEGNSGEIVIGDVAVVAASATRQGVRLYPSTSMEFFVVDLSQLYIDSTQNGDKVHYYYESRPQ